MLYIFFQLNKVTSKLYEKWLAEASAQRRDYIHRYARHKDRLLSLCAYRLLCFALKRNAVTLNFNEYGKPELIGDTRRFSISHCEGCAAVGISEIEAEEIGVDAELIKPYPKNILKRVFTQSEIELIKASARPDAAFFKLWTLKESYVKAIGRGLSFPLQEIEFKLCDDEIKCSDGNYSFYSYEINSHVISSCEKARSALRIVGVDELIH